MDKSLHARFADLDRRIAELESQKINPEEHDVAELLNDLRGKRERMRGYLDPNRGTAATWASTKDAPEGASPTPEDVPGPGTGTDPTNTARRQPDREFETNSPVRSQITDDAEAEKEMEAMERAFNRAQTRFR